LSTTLQLHSSTGAGRAHLVLVFENHGAVVRAQCERQAGGPHFLADIRLQPHARAVQAKRGGEHAGLIRAPGGLCSNTTGAPAHKNNVMPAACCLRAHCVRPQRHMPAVGQMRPNPCTHFLRRAPTLQVRASPACNKQN